jgi:hypothetical protein
MTTVEIYEELGRRTALRARIEKNDDWAIQEEDETLVKGFIKAAVEEISVKVGINTFEYQSAAVPDNLNKEFRLALIYHVLKQWFDSIGANKEADYWWDNYIKEIQTYRFIPRIGSTTQRKYVPVM